MQNRRVLLVLLLVSIAVVSGLIGLVIGWSGGTRGRELMGQTVSGDDVSFGGIEKIRFYEGPRIAAQYAYWMEGERGDRFLVSCCNRRSPVIFSVYYTDGRHEANVHRGINRASQAIYHLEGGTAYEGINNKGPAVWSVCGGGDNICVGKGEQGAQVYHVERGRVYRGSRVTTDVLLTSDDENYEDDPLLMLLIPILAENLWEQW